MSIIRFYRVNEKYGNFSNFAPSRIFIDGENWTTVEHYFQANKFDDESLRSKIKKFESPMKAANEGRKRKHALIKDWEEKKETIMFKGLMAKFLQNPNLKKELLQTGTMLIVEHTKNDDYWGDGGDGNGLNRLGLLLMEVRSKLRSIHNDADLVFPPWIAFPGIDQADMFWRMGLGEEYMTKWSNYFKSITTKKEYKIAFPQPNDWDKFYQYSV